MLVAACSSVKGFLVESVAVDAREVCLGCWLGALWVVSLEKFSKYLFTLELSQLISMKYSCDSSKNQIKSIKIILVYLDERGVYKRMVNKYVKLTFIQAWYHTDVKNEDHKIISKCSGYS